VLATDTDTDGAADCVDTCTASAYTVPTSPPDQCVLKSTIIIKNLDKAPGSQGVVVKGFFNPASTSPTIDPATNGVHFVLQDSLGTLYNINIPGGLRTPKTPNPPHCDPNGLDGWKVRVTASGKTIWKYINKSGQLPPTCAAASARGIFLAIVKDLTVTPKNAFQYIVKSKNDTLPHTPAYPVTLMQANLALAEQPPGKASAQAAVGECAESVFSSPGTALPKPFCKEAPKPPKTRKKIVCKGL
jgi:hypothetical protein